MIIINVKKCTGGKFLMLLGIVIGMFIGAFIGVSVMCLLFYNRE